MSLKFPSSWRFTIPEGLEPIPPMGVADFFELIAKVAAQGDRWKVIELFKGIFAGMLGSVHARSSSESWAETDLRSYMNEAAENPPLFIDALYSGLEIAGTKMSLGIPDTSIINDLCWKHDIYILIEDGSIKLTKSTPVIRVPPPPPTLREASAQLLEESVIRSEELLADNRGKEAVQEMLWVLESLATGFRDLSLPTGQVKGRYFNQIVKDLKNASQGTTLNRALEWCEQLHGYLSSPTGGGVRHGIDLNAGDPISTNEATFFCNLIRSYVGFLQSEHERINGEVKS